ncbi:MAG TPA: carbohydrate ABC transporter permease [candidate division Zixibacteria bacterium]|nr:carbohydrate ABC transporter permease [candidate division Zixibacteria bacterium]
MSRARSIGSTWWMYGLLTVLAALWMVPVVTVIMSAVRPLGEIRDGWWNLAGATFTLDNFFGAWNEADLGSKALNSLIITSFSVVATVAIGALASYAFVRLRFHGRGLIYFLLISTMIVPVQIILIPLLPWFRTLGFAEGTWQPFMGMVLVHAAFGLGWAVFMMGSFMASVPVELTEAGQIDGAGHFDVFRRIVLPLALPGIVSFAIIDFVFVWNDLLLGLTLLDADHAPLTVGIANLQSAHLAQQDVISAGALLAILPPLALFVALNRYYVRGLFSGGVK